jgi:hypothetical protein
MGTKLGFLLVVLGHFDAHFLHHFARVLRFFVLRCGRIIDCDSNNCAS